MLLDFDYNGFLLKPEVEDLNDHRKKSSGVYTLFSLLIDFYDPEQTVELKRKKQTIMADKLDHSIKISLFKFILGKKKFS